MTMTLTSWFEYNTLHRFRFFLVLCCIGHFMFMSEPFVRSYQLVLVPNVTTIHRRVGETLLVKCAIKDMITNTLSPYTPTKWISPQNEIISTVTQARVHIEPRKGEVILRNSNVTLSDDGEWRCLSESPPSMIRFRLTVEDVIKIRANRIEYVPLGQSFHLKCLLAVSSEVAVRWRKGPDKIPITEHDPDYDISSGDGILLKNVRLSDNDTFWCSAYNFEAGVKSEQPIQVIVTEPIIEPKITCQSEPCGIEAQKAVLTCHSTSVPAPKFQWSKGPTLNIRPTAELKYHIEDNSLTIYNLTKADSGSYKCRVFNAYDKLGKSTSYNLKVLFPPKIRPIQTVTALSDPNLGKPAQAELKCEVDSPASGDDDDNTISFRWFDANNQPLLLGADQRNIRIVDSNNPPRSRLIFPHPSAKELGTYTCEAKNSAGLHTSSGSLLVRSHPKFDIIASPDVFYAVAGLESEVTCALTGFPLPTVTWRDSAGVKVEPGSHRGYEVLRIRERFDTPGHVTSVMTLRVAGFGTSTPKRELSFSCEILNGAERRSVLVREAELPGKAEMAPRPEIKMNSIRFGVLIPTKLGLPEPEALVVRCKAVKANHEDLSPPFSELIIPLNKSQIRSPPTLVNVTVADLKAGSLHRLGVCLRTSAGCSQWTENLFITQAKNSPSVEIYVSASSGAADTASTDGLVVVDTGDRMKTNNGDDVTASTIHRCFSHNSCLIRWRIVSDGGDVIESANVHYARFDPRKRAASSDQSTINLPCATAPMAQAFLKDLEPSTVYNISLKIVNRAKLKFERSFLAQTLVAPPGYVVIATNRQYFGTWKLLVSLFGAAVFVCLMCLGVPFFNVTMQKNSKKPAKKSCDGLDDDFMILDKDPNISTESTLIDRVDSSTIAAGATSSGAWQQPPRHQSRVNAEQRAQPAARSSTFRSWRETAATGDGLENANVNPLYHDLTTTVRNAAGTAVPWNVFSDNRTASNRTHQFYSTGATNSSRRHHSQNDFSRV